MSSEKRYVFQWKTRHGRGVWCCSPIKSGGGRPSRTWIEDRAQLEKVRKERDPEGNLEIEREWFEGADGISFDNQTKFKGMTQDQFIDWIDSMVLHGDLPKGKWIEDTVNGLTYHFDKSLLVEQTEKEFKKKSS